MSLLNRLQRIFVPAPESSEETSSIDPSAFDDSGSFFEWSQHIRILLAIVVVFVSALIMWWIVA